MQGYFSSITNYSASFGLATDPRIMELNWLTWIYKLLNIQFANLESKRHPFWNQRTASKHSSIARRSVVCPQYKKYWFILQPGL